MQGNPRADRRGRAARALAAGLLLLAWAVGCGPAVRALPPAGAPEAAAAFKPVSFALLEVRIFRIDP